MKKYILLVILISFVFAIHSESLNDEGSLMAVLYHQVAAEYQALCYQAYNLASDRLILLAGQNHTKPLAVIMDVDETVLSNSKYNALEVMRAREYPKEFYQWIEEMRSEPIAGALQFTVLADSLGIKIFYITNRRDHKQAATIGNLKKYGFPQAEPDQVLCKARESSKEGRRLQVMADYDVLLLIGDNLIDFAEYFAGDTIEERAEAVEEWQSLFGRRYIVLPNTMHGYWQKIITDFEYDLTPEQIREKRINHLKY
ncbi:MAG: 5'-nucleotidase, lipoprotein e(P4) family [Candidatus Cloacimonetes bacterium]|nr:5'-nucleotidase, lipoprotein e(P4) family [Candidatus Cloacimonadota bacterium]